MASTTAARAAATSSAWRTWNATDGPLRSTNSHGGDTELGGDPAGQDRGRVAMRVERRVRDDTQPLRATAARQRPVLQPMIAEVLDAADPHPARDVRHDPTGQDGDVDPPRSLGRDARERAQAALGERLDDGDRRVARADRQGAVEVDDDEQRAPGGARGDRAPTRHRPGRRSMRGPPAAVTA